MNVEERFDNGAEVTLEFLGQMNECLSSGGTVFL